MEASNAFAGLGPVMLDIGDDVGALVVRMPAELVGNEVEIRPVGQGEDHHDDNHHHHGHETGHDHGDGQHHPHPHVAVVARATGTGLQPSLVFGELREGSYGLSDRVDGVVRLRVEIRGGEVTEANWPRS